MAIIKHIIPQRNFEKVNERIGAILTLELENQKSLQGFSDPVNVFLERQDNFKDAEVVMVNVMFDSLNPNAENQRTSQNTAKYNIDVYAAGKSGSDHGGKSSSLRLQKFSGMIQYILSYTGYKTLGFEPGVIGGVEIDSIQIADPDVENTGYVTMGRITVSVRMIEEMELETGTLMLTAITGVKLNLTEQGYQYKIETL